MGFLHWLSLVGRFQMPKNVPFWWREAQRPTFSSRFCSPLCDQFAFRNIGQTSLLIYFVNWGNELNILCKLIINLQRIPRKLLSLNNLTNFWMRCSLALSSHVVTSFYGLFTHHTNTWHPNCINRVNNRLSNIHVPVKLVWYDLNAR